MKIIKLKSFRKRILIYLVIILILGNCIGYSNIRRGNSFTILPSKKLLTKEILNSKTSLPKKPIDYMGYKIYKFKTGWKVNYIGFFLIIVPVGIFYPIQKDLIYITKNNAIIGVVESHISNSSSFIGCILPILPGIIWSKKKISLQVQNRETLG